MEFQTLDSYFLSYGEFVEFIMKLRVQPCSRHSRAAHVKPCHWSEGRGVSLWDRRATMQVMLGVSLRARWDATLVIIIMNIWAYHDIIFNFISRHFHFRSRRKTADAMRLPLQFYFMYFILLCTVIVAKKSVTLII